MNFKVNLCQLSAAFYEAYPQSSFPEIMIKNFRPYSCLMIETHEDYLICIPFRFSIQHQEAFLFHNTQRSKKTLSGLNYKKTVIIKNSNYIDSDTTVLVDTDEYTAMMTNIDTIVNEVHEYISTYVKHQKGIAPLHRREFIRRYQYSTLPYFHNELGI